MFIVSLDLEEGEVRELHLVRISEEVVLVQREGELLQGLVVVAWNQEILIISSLSYRTHPPPKWDRQVSKNLQGRRRSRREADLQQRICLLEMSFGENWI